MPDKTILVTGASGFIGRQTLLPLIEIGYKVHGVSRGQGLAIPQVQWHSCDLLDAAAVENLLAKVQPSHLMHVAWHTEHRKFWTAPENAVWLEASAGLFECFVRHGGKRILGIGSCAEYDWQRKDKTAWKETDSCRPHTPYGQAKNALQERLAALSAKTSVSSAWARIFLLFGPHENPERLVPYAVLKSLAGEMVLCSEGTQVRDLIDTRLCGRALAQLVDSDVAGPVNIASGDAMPVADLVKLICALCGQEGNAKFGAMPMNENEPPFMLADLSRLRNEVRFGEHQDTRRSLTELIGWWHDNYPAGK